MKALLFFATVLALPLLANAGDNGSYVQCVSSSGRTELLMGTVGSALEPESVQFSIDGKTFGPAQVEEGVMLSIEKHSDGGETRIYTEADHEAMNWVTVRLSSPDSHGRQRAQILGGMDPRDQTIPIKQIDSPINVRCKTVYNPI